MRGSDLPPWVKERKEPVKPVHHYEEVGRFDPRHGAGEPSVARTRGEHDLRDHANFVRPGYRSYNPAKSGCTGYGVEAARTLT